MITDQHGTRRYRVNAVVRWAFDNCFYSLPELAARGFPAEDLAQFAQLVGCTEDNPHTRVVEEEVEV